MAVNQTQVFTVYQQGRFMRADISISDGPGASLSILQILDIVTSFAVEHSIHHVGWRKRLRKFSKGFWLWVDRVHPVSCTECSYKIWTECLQQQFEDSEK